MDSKQVIEKALDAAKNQQVLITFDYRIVKGKSQIEKMVRDFPGMCIGVYDDHATADMIAEDLQ